jgi:hypothetical protein
MEKTRGEHSFRRAKAERTAAVTDVEDHATAPRLEHLLPYASVRQHRRVWEWPEAVRQDISTAQPRDHLEAARRRVVEMRHDRKPGLLGNFERYIERGDPGGAARIPPDAHLDAGDQIAVRLDDPHAFARIEKPQICALADHYSGAEGEDAGERDVEIGNMRSGEGSITWRRKP